MAETMTVSVWVFDVLLASALVGLAGMSLASYDLFRAVVLFIPFGLLMALAWVRLQAPDIALAEAGIGAGLTGALLLAALRRMSTGNDCRPDHRHSGQDRCEPEPSGPQEKQPPNRSLR